MPRPDADPHGGIEDFKNIEAIKKSEKPGVAKPGYTDDLDYH